jgi:hypothetical protein
MAILIQLDGVLRDRRRKPIPYGFKLMEALKDRRKVILLCSDWNEADMWLRMNKVYKSHELLDNNLPCPKDDPEYRRIEYLSGCGPVDCVITSDERLAEKVNRLGVNTLVFKPGAINDYDINYEEPSEVKWDSVIRDMQDYKELTLKQTLSEV